MDRLFTRASGRLAIWVLINVALTISVVATGFNDDYGHLQSTRQALDAIQEFEASIPSTPRYTSSGNNKRLLNHPLAPVLLQESFRRAKLARLTPSTEQTAVTTLGEAGSSSDPVTPVRFVKNLDDAIEEDPRRTSETRVQFKRLSGPDKDGLSTWQVIDQLKPAPFNVVIPESGATGHFDRLYKGLDEQSRLQALRTHGERRRERARRRKFIQRMQAKGRKPSAFHDDEEVIGDSEERDGDSDSDMPLVKRKTVNEDEKEDELLRAAKDPLGRVALHDAQSPLWGSFARAFWATLELVPQSYFDTYWFERANIDEESESRLPMWIAFEATEVNQAPGVPLVLRFPWYLFVDTQRKRESLFRGEWYKIGEARTLQQDGQQGASARIYFDPEDALKDVQHLWRYVGTVHRFAQLSPPGTPGLLRFCMTGHTYEALRQDPYAKPNLRSFNFWLSPPSGQVEAGQSHQNTVLQEEMINRNKVRLGSRRKRRKGGAKKSGAAPLGDRPTAIRHKVNILPPLGQSSPNSTTEQRDSSPPAEESSVSLEKRSDFLLDEPAHSDIGEEIRTLPMIRPDSIFASSEAGWNALAVDLPGATYYLYRVRDVLSFREYLLTARIQTPHGEVHDVATKFYVPIAGNQLHGPQKRSPATESGKISQSQIKQFSHLSKRSLGDDLEHATSDVSRELDAMPNIHDGTIFPNAHAAARAVFGLPNITSYTLEFNDVVLSYREYRLSATFRQGEGRSVTYHKLIYIPIEDFKSQGMSKRKFRDTHTGLHEPTSGHSSESPAERSSQLRKRSLGYDSEAAESDVSKELDAMPNIHNGTIFANIDAVVRAVADLPNLKVYTFQLEQIVMSFREYLLAATFRQGEGKSHTCYRLIYIPNKVNQLQGMSKRKFEPKLSAKSNRVDRSSPLSKRGLPFDPYSRPLQLPAFNTHEEVLKAIEKYWPSYTEHTLKSVHRLTEDDTRDMIAYSYILSARAPNGQVVEKRFDFYRKMWLVYKPLHIFNTLAEARQHFLEKNPTLREVTFTGLRALSDGEDSDLHRFRYDITIPVPLSHLPSTSNNGFSYDFYLRNQPMSPSDSPHAPGTNETALSSPSWSPGWPWASDADSPPSATSTPVQGSSPNSSSPPLSPPANSSAAHDAPDNNGADVDTMQERDGGARWRTTPEAIELIFGP